MKILHNNSFNVCMIISLKTIEIPGKDIVIHEETHFHISLRCSGKNVSENCIVDAHTNLLGTAMIVVLNRSREYSILFCAAIERHQHSRPKHIQQRHTLNISTLIHIIYIESQMQDCNALRGTHTQSHTRTHAY